MADLATIEEARVFLQRPGGDTEQDAIVQALLTRATQAIITHTAREFLPQSTDLARKFVYPGNGLVDLSPYDLASVSGGAHYVKIDSDTTAPTTLNTDQYRLYPRQPKDGVFTYLKLAPSIGSPNVFFRDREVEIKGNWGFPSVPEDVKHWCLVTVATWLNRDVAAFEATFSIDEGRLERPLALPTAVVAGLAHYKREAV